MIDLAAVQRNGAKKKLAAAGSPAPQKSRNIYRPGESPNVTGSLMLPPGNVLISSVPEVVVDSGPCRSGGTQCNSCRLVNRTANRY